MRGLLLAEKPSVMRAIKEVYDKENGKFGDDLDFGAFHDDWALEWYNGADFAPDYLYRHGVEA